MSIGYHNYLAGHELVRRLYVEFRTGRSLPLSHGLGSSNHCAYNVVWNR